MSVIIIEVLLSSTRLGYHVCVDLFQCSVSTALDEAATALTRMKSEKQTYEAFLRGANQAPSSLSVSAPNNQQQPQPVVSQPSYPPVSSVAMATSISCGSGKGGGPGSDGAGVVGGGGGGKMPNQQKELPQQRQQQQQPQVQNQQQQVQNQQQQQPLDGMQTVQRLLSQGAKGSCPTASLTGQHALGYSGLAGQTIQPLDLV